MKAEREAGEPPSQSALSSRDAAKRTVLLISFPGRAKISPQELTAQAKILVRPEPLIVPIALFRTPCRIAGPVIRDRLASTRLIGGVAPACAD